MALLVNEYSSYVHSTFVRAAEFGRIKLVEFLFGIDGISAETANEAFRAAIRGLADTKERYT